MRRKQRLSVFSDKYTVLISTRHPRTHRVAVKPLGGVFSDPLVPHSDLELPNKHNPVVADEIQRFRSWGAWDVVAAATVWRPSEIPHKLVPSQVLTGDIRIA